MVLWNLKFDGNAALSDEERGEEGEDAQMADGIHSCSHSILHDGEGQRRGRRK